MARARKSAIGTINLDDLFADFPHITQAASEMRAHAALVCFDNQRHTLPVTLDVQGAFDESVQVSCAHAVTDAMIRELRNLNTATEWGAEAVAFLLVRHLTGFQIIEMSAIGTGFDWWVGKKKGSGFQRCARLEVSGILSGDETQLNARVRQKLEQTTQSDDLGRPAFVVVVEFSAPRSRVMKR